MNITMDTNTLEAVKCLAVPASVGLFFVLYWGFCSFAVLMETITKIFGIKKIKEIATDKKVK